MWRDVARMMDMPVSMLPFVDSVPRPSSPEIAGAPAETNLGSASNECVVPEGLGDLSRKSSSHSTSDEDGVSLTKSLVPTAPVRYLG